MSVQKNKYLTYREKPIIRKGDDIYYGNLDDKYILALKVLETKEEYGMKVATKVKLELQDNSGELGKGGVYRKTEREDLYHALDLGAFWLEDALDADSNI